MKHHKGSKLFILAALALSALLLAGCSAAPQNTPGETTKAGETTKTEETVKTEETTTAEQTQSEPVVIKIGLATDDTEIWQAVQKVLDDAGENIKIDVMNVSPTDPNELVAAGDLDLNAFQHAVWLNQQIGIHGYDLTSIGTTILVPLNLFSVKYTSLDELPDKAKILIGNDVVNQGRGLLVLQSAGLIEVDEAAGYTPGLKDITSNPHDYEFVELDLAQIPRALADADAGIVNCGYAVDAGLDLEKNVIYKDEIDLNSENYQRYFNLLVTRTADKDNVNYQKVVKAYHTPEVAEAIESYFKGAALPAWEPVPYGE